MVTEQEGDRGQLILIGALAVALTILASVVLLNAVNESPDVVTQQDSRSLVEADRTAKEVRSGLERTFLVNTSVNETGEPLPYAREGSYGAVVGEYSDRYANLSTIDGPGVVRVELVDTRTGGVARQNETTLGFREFNATNDPVTVIRDADSIPRLVLLVNDTDLDPSETFTVRIDDGSDDATIRVTDTDAEIAPAGAPGRTCTYDEEPITLAFTNGTGAVRTAETYCEVRDAYGSLSPPVDVIFENGTDARGTFTVTGVDASGSDITGTPGVDNRWYSDSIGGDDYIVNPVFRVEYRNPNISYNATFGLYNGTQQ